MLTIHHIWSDWLIIEDLTAIASKALDRRVIPSGHRTPYKLSFIHTSPRILHLVPLHRGLNLGICRHAHDWHAVLLIIKLPLHRCSLMKLRHLVLSLHQMRLVASSVLKIRRLRNFGVESMQRQRCLNRRMHQVLGRLR